MHAHETIYNLQLDNLRNKRVVAKYYLEPISQPVNAAAWSIKMAGRDHCCGVESNIAAAKAPLPSRVGRGGGGGHQKAP